MDWSNERWRKLYIRDTEDDRLLSWESRALWHEMIKRCDDSGLIRTRRGASGLALLTDIPAEVVERALPPLLEDGRVVSASEAFVLRNFIEAQEAKSTDRLRKQESRSRARSKALSNSPYDGVTNRDRMSPEVTASHDSSQGVTLRSERRERLEERDARAREVFGLSVTKRDMRPHELDAIGIDRRRCVLDPSAFDLFTSSGAFVRTVRYDDDGLEVEVDPWRPGSNP